MLKFFVADQCTKRHNKNSQPGCLDVFDKNLHALTSRPLPPALSLPSPLPPSTFMDFYGR